MNKEWYPEPIDAEIDQPTDEELLQQERKIEAEIKATRITYPIAIETTALALADLSVELDDYKHELGQIEDGILAEITCATNEQGKPLFSNETTRGIELRARLNAHETWLRLDKIRRDFEKKKATKAAELERLRNEFREHLIERQFELERFTNGLRHQEFTVA